MKLYCLGKRGISLCVVGVLLLFTVVSCVQHNAVNDKEQGIAKSGVDSADLTIDVNKLHKLADTVLTNYKVAVFAKDSLKNKHESLYIQVTDLEGKGMDSVAIDYAINMDMGNISHGGPYYPLVGLGNGLFKAEVVFIMANLNDMGKGWMINIDLNKEHELSFLLPVAEAKHSRMISVDTKDDSRVFVSLLLPEHVSSGSQALNFTLHKMGHVEFPALDNYKLEFIPFMPSMGHGSTGNEAAVSLGDGKYAGVVNLTMPGEWIIKVNLLKNGEKVSQDSLVFPVEVK